MSFLGANAAISAQSTHAVVHVNAIDTVNRKCSGMFGDGSDAQNVDTSFPIGAVQVTPAVGETWMCERVGTAWRLVTQMPIDTPALSGAAAPAPGQVQLGSSGPMELHGSVINVRAPLNTYSPATLPSAVDAGVGAQVYDIASSRPVWSDGTLWRDAQGNPV